MAKKARRFRRDSPTAVAIVPLIIVNQSSDSHAACNEDVRRDSKHQRRRPGMDVVESRIAEVAITSVYRARLSE